MSISLLDKDPLALVVMGITTVTVTLGFMNLILTVIVEQAAEARARDVEEVARQKVEDKAEAKKALLKHCEGMDQDSNGKLSVDELMRAYEYSSEFRNLMTVMDVTSAELQIVFEMADRLGTGEIEYATFCDELFRIKTQDHRSLLVMMRHGMKDQHHMLQKLYKQLDMVEGQGARCLAQVELLHKKIGHTSSATTSVQSPVAFECDRFFYQELRMDKNIESPATQNKMGADVSPESRCSNEDTEPPVSIHLTGSGMHVLRTSNLQSWNYLQNLQQAVQCLVDVDAYLLDQVTQQIDISFGKLTHALRMLTHAEGDRNEHDIKTIEVWLAGVKYEQCKLRLNAISPIGKIQAMKHRHEEWQPVPIEAEGIQNMIATHQHVFSRLKDLQLELLQLDALAVPGVPTGALVVSFADARRQMVTTV